LRRQNDKFTEKTVYLTITHGFHSLIIQKNKKIVFLPGFNEISKSIYLRDIF
jgi:hypothetical protein